MVHLRINIEISKPAGDCPLRPAAPLAPEVIGEKRLPLM